MTLLFSFIVILNVTLHGRFSVWLITFTFHNSLDLLSGGVTGVRDSKLTLRCVWYQSSDAAADGKSLLPLMSKSFIQNSPLQELVYTWKATPLNPHRAYLKRWSTKVTALRAYTFVFYS